MGQSNLAACATIGSNHNSRAPDGEIQAGRGFWPGLCVSVKHNCRFASFLLLAKGDYPSELDVPLPFALLSNDEAHDRLLLMPAYWWLYNMYALARNAWKFGARDKRCRKVQHVEFDSLAPDTAEEMLRGMALLEEWVGKASLAAGGESAEGRTSEDLRAVGRELLEGPAEAVESLDVLGEGVEKGPRKTVVLKAHEGYHAYRDMLRYYAAKNLLAWMEANADADLAAMTAALAGPRETRWMNLGGQLVQGPDVDALRADVKAGTLDSWDAIHTRYDELWARYPEDKCRHALATLLALEGADELTAEAWQAALDRGVEIQKYVADQVYQSRKKDFEDPFRAMVYSSPEEMEAVLGSAEDNSFVKQVREETEAFEERVAAVKSRG
jgi:hypothetical protein